MDTKPLEHEALHEIQSKLARFGYKYANINFDENGGDFYIIREIDNNRCVYLRGQSKGRSINNNSSNVVIPKDYVQDGFLVFVYVKPEDPDDVATFLYTTEDIKTLWRENDNSYTLYLSKDFIYNGENNRFLFKKTRAEIVDNLLTIFGEESRQNYINAVSDSGFYFKMWQKTGGLPSVEYLRELLARNSAFEYFETSKLVFLLCALVIQNQESDTSLSIDWAFYYLKGRIFKKPETNQVLVRKQYHSVVAITYPRTGVNELASESGELIGYHLHIGDEEEVINAYVWR